MINYIKNLKANYTASALICMVVGIVLIIWPATSTQVVCMVLGGVLLIYGIIQIVLYLIARERTLYLQGMLMLGIIFGVVGAWILLRPDMIIRAVPVIVGLIIIMHGIHNVAQAFDLKRMSYDRWWLALIFGMLTVLLGGVLVRNPFTVVNTVVRVIGAFLIYDGISDVWIISRVFKTKKDREMIIDAEAVEVEDP